MNIGFFTKQDDGTLTGSLPTLGFHDVSVEPIQTKGNGPDYAVTVEGAELGVAWNKTSQNGKAYVSIKVVIPGRPAFYLAMFQSGETATHVAVYDEPKKQNTKPADASA